MLTVIYRRVSTGYQDNSLEQQEARNAAYCEFKGLTNATGAPGASGATTTFTDEATSGTLPFTQRPGGGAIMRKIVAGEVAHLVVAKLDRLGRNARDLLEVCDRLKKHKVDLHIVDLGVNTRSAAGKMLFGIMAVLAEFECSNIRDRITATLRHKHEQGEAVSHAPYGWDLAGSGRINAKSGKEINNLVPNLDEQNVVRQILRLRADGHSMSAIARLLNQNAVPSKIPAGTVIKTRNGDRLCSGLWGVGSVAHVLSSRYTQQLIAADQQQQAA